MAPVSLAQPMACDQCAPHEIFTARRQRPGTCTWCEWEGQVVPIDAATPRNTIRRYDGPPGGYVRVRPCRRRVAAWGALP